MNTVPMSRAHVINATEIPFKTLDTHFMIYLPCLLKGFRVMATGGGKKPGVEANERPAAVNISPEPSWFCPNITHLGRSKDLKIRIVIMCQS
jgi:hypothetical protein